MTGRDGSPFVCEQCSDKDRELRNCFNRLGLSDAARAVTEYTWAVVEELKNPLQNPPLPPFSEGGSKGNSASGSGGGPESPDKGGPLSGIEKARQRPAQKVFSLGDIRLYECPASYISRDTVEIMRLVYLVDDSGRLLHSGGWGSQPAWLVEAVEAFRMERMSSVKASRDSDALTG